ncbi:MAG TPA: nuclear transport factor 2 family protein [Chthoniobacterales bacterium]
MKKLFIFSILLATVVASAAPPDESEIAIRENAVWRAVQQKKLEQFQQLVSPQVRGVFADGIMVMQDYLKAIPKRTIKSISLSDFKVVFPDSETASIAYIAKVKTTTASGPEVTTTYNAGSVWRKSKGRWQAIFHGEAKQVSAKSVPPASTPAGAH